MAAAAAAMLNRLNVQQTKSRPDHSSDNGLAETKNGGVIRKHPGYDQIRFGARRPGERLLCGTLVNPYRNFHRPCGSKRLSPSQTSYRSATAVP